MILVLGGAGYIGSHTNKELRKAGFDTIIGDNLVYGHRELALKTPIIEIDLIDKSSIRKLFSKYNIQAVMHFAAYASVGESISQPSLYYQNNFIGSWNLLEVMREYKVRQIVFSSTCATYGIPKQIPIPENHPQNPVNPYGNTKLMVEKMLKDYQMAYGIDSVIFRYFNAAGADPDSDLGEWHEPETHLIPLLLDAALGKRKNIQIFGTDYETPDGTCIRDYIHVSDLAQAHVLGLKKLLNGSGSAVYNLGNGEGYSVKKVIETVKNESAKDFEVVESERRQGDPAILIGSCEKALNELGWKPQYTNLSEIINTAWQWHSRQFNTLAL